MSTKLAPRHRSRDTSPSAGRQSAGNESSGPSDPEGRESDDYEVGYAKPPRHTRFKSGRSGNPAGRPTGSRNLKTELAEELHELILVNESGTRRTVSKQRAMLKSLTARAVQGDPRAANLILNLVLRLLTQDDEGEDHVDLDEEDLEILKAFEDRMKRRSRKPKET